MPKKKEPDTQEAQSERFREAVCAAIAAGDLSPTEADEAFERALKNSTFPTRSRS